MSARELPADARPAGVAGGAEGAILSGGDSAAQAVTLGTATPPVAGPARFAFIGRVGSLTAADRARLVKRGARTPDPKIEAGVAAIIEQVRARGDDALRELAEHFDGVRLEALEVPRADCVAALDSLDPVLRGALERSAAALATFHRAQRPAELVVETAPGVRLRRRPEPLARVGIYAPGGRAAYPSSVLMGLVPARAAGVTETVVCSPPGPDGRPAAVVLAACALAGADRVFALGGAGAIAALACGTASVPPVDRIVGPGNAWVTEAKRQVSRVVAIDSPAGPSELLIVADSSADAELLAAELVAQAEHDPDAACVLITMSPSHLEAVAVAAGRLAAAGRNTIVTRALAARGALLLADSLEQALQLVSEYAPEHLLVATRDPQAALPHVRAAGTVFLGLGSSVVFGDYVTGANHVLPTMGLSRSYSGLDTLDFVRFVTVQEVAPAAAARLAADAAVLADAEGLPGHAHAARLRLGGEDAADAPPRLRVMPRPDYADIHTYDPGREPCALDLSDNTNRFGMGPAARAVLQAPADALIARYPSPYATQLKHSLARVWRVDPAAITTGCGSDDVIDSAIRAFCEPGDRLAFPWPTFGIVPTFTRMNGVRPLPVDWTDAGEPDIDALLADGARAVYLCRPNNPTGHACSRAAIERLTCVFAGLVLIDEAYADFADDDLLDLACASDNTVVIRTFSKAYGLAGLRLGVAVGPPPLIREIEKSRGPYKVGALAEAMALAVLEDGSAWRREAVLQVRENRERLAERLRALGFAVPRSSANFLLVPLRAGASATELARRLRERGVGVRPFPELPRYGDCVRVTIGPWPEMETFLAAFADVAS